MESSNRNADLVARSPQGVTASIEEIRYAEQLRREIESRYLAVSSRPSDPYWCVAAD